jgi:curved DNA-binding protein CbpA
VTDGIDAYKVLQVDPEAEDEVIQAAYRRLAQKYHPDRQPDADGIARMVAINAAWEMIGEPARRVAYDRERAAGQRHAAAPGPPASSPASQGTGARSATPPTRPPAGFGSPSSPPGGRTAPPAETVSRDWTSGRSFSGGGYDARTMRAPEGLGAAGPPPGKPSGTVLGFGRYAGWSLGEIARTDLGYLEWLDRMAIGRAYRDEIDAILRRAGRRKSAESEAAERHGLFRRR